MAVYFVQAGTHGPIKIGCSHNPATRIKMISGSSPVPLTVLAVIPGDFALERLILNRFAHLRTGRYDWFEPGADLIAFCAQPHIDELSDPALAKLLNGTVRDLITTLGYRSITQLAEDLGLRRHNVWQFIDRPVPTWWLDRLARLWRERQRWLHLLPWLKAVSPHTQTILIREVQDDQALLAALTRNGHDDCQTPH